MALLFYVSHYLCELKHVISEWGFINVHVHVLAIKQRVACTESVGAKLWPWTWSIQTY